MLLRYTQALITQMAQTAVEYDLLLPIPLAALRGNSFTTMCASRRSRRGATRRLAAPDRHCIREQLDPQLAPPRLKVPATHRRVSLATAQNHLIELLPRKDRLRLLAICEPVQLVLAEVPCKPGKRTRHVYFPADGLVSLMAQMDGNSRLEVGMVGREGMLGAELNPGCSDRAIACARARAGRGVAHPHRRPRQSDAKPLK